MQSILKPIAAAVAALAALAGCQTAPTADAELSAARSAFERARTDPYANRTGAVEIERAQQALNSAEQAASGKRDSAQARHFAYLAMQRSEIAMAMGAQAQSDETVQKAGQERERLRLEARTREAEQANRSARNAQADAQAMRAQAALESDRAGALERDLQSLQARNTQRGTVVTLGDVLFETGKADLQSRAQRSVDQLAVVLKQYSGRRVLIEGFTDSVGAENTNLELSQRRAAAFQQALEKAGVDAGRMEIRAWGEANPVAPNTTSAGRQQNRRVEVVFSDEKGQFAGPSSQQQPQATQQNSMPQPTTP